MRGRVGDRDRLLRDGARRRSRLYRSAASRAQSGCPVRALYVHGRRACRHTRRRRRRRGARWIGAAIRLPGASGQTLDEAVRGFPHRRHRRDERARPVVAGTNFRRRRPPLSCTATTASATSCSRGTAFSSSACSTGSSRPSAIRSPTSPTCAWDITTTNRGIRVSSPIPAARRGFPVNRSFSTSIAAVRASPRSRIGAFYLAFSFFRLAAILQGVYRRGLEGNASSREALSKRELVRVCAETGWRLRQ